MAREVKVWRTDDGALFEYQDEAIIYEKLIRSFSVLPDDQLKEKTAELARAMYRDRFMWKGLFSNG